MAQVNMSYIPKLVKPPAKKRIDVSAALGKKNINSPLRPTIGPKINTFFGSVVPPKVNPEGALGIQKPKLNPTVANPLLPISGVGTPTSAGAGGFNPLTSRGYPSALPVNAYNTERLLESGKTQKRISVPDTDEWFTAGVRTLVKIDKEGYIATDEQGNPLWKPGAAGTIPGTPAYKSREEIEAWKASGYDPAFQPHSISPVLGAIFGLTEEDRISLGYSPTTTHKEGDKEYLWPLATQPSSGGGGSGYSTQAAPSAPSESSEPAGPGKPSWAETYHIPGAPDWWRGVTPSFSSPELEYAGLLNSMIPFLSSEDQRSMATYLYTLYPDAFGTYNATLGNFQGAPTQQFDLEGRRINTQTNGIPFLGQAFSDSYTRNTYSQERANAMLAALDTIGSKMPKTGGTMGPGYQYLKQVASAVRDFGAVGNAMPTRQQLTQLVSALDPLIAMTQSDSLSAYGPLVRNMTTPFMSAGRVMPVSKLEDGSYIFGEANKSLF